MANEITHESFGVVVMTRRHGGDSRMFGSALKHHNRIAITVSEGSVERSLGEDRILPGKQIIEFQFSEVDFARFVTSAGIGGGVPCTLTRRPSAPGLRITDEPPVHMSTAETFKSEAAERIDTGMSKVKQASKMVAELAAQPRVTKGDLNKLLSLLTLAVQDVESNAPFMVQQAHETIEKMTTNAKAEIEAFTRQMALQMGIEAMASDELAPKLIE